MDEADLSAPGRMSRSDAWIYRSLGLSRTNDRSFNSTIRFHGGQAACLTIVEHRSRRGGDALSDSDRVAPGSTFIGEHDVEGTIVVRISRRDRAASTAFPSTVRNRRTSPPRHSATPGRADPSSRPCRRSESAERDRSLFTDEFHESPILEGIRDPVPEDPLAVLLPRRSRDERHHAVHHAASRLRCETTFTGE